MNTAGPLITEDDKLRLIANINAAFTPGAPINSRDLFAGRSKEVEKAIGTIFQPGQHSVIYGERGVGKTSLANTLFDVLVNMGKANYQTAKLTCSEAMNFAHIWRGIFRQLRGKDENIDLATTLGDDPHSENVREVFQAVADPSIVIIDEFDRIKDTTVHTALADTIKTLSDNAINTTLIMVGVADSLIELLKEDLSIILAIRGIPMQRMSKAELLGIMDKGMNHCHGLSIVQPAKERIADYSQGLPSITHLLAREAGLEAVRSFRTVITMSDLERAIVEAVDSQSEFLLEAYRSAVSAPRGIHFKPVLLACAVAAKDDHGFFYAKDVTEPLRLISHKPNFNIPAFAFHLKAFCSESRGKILEKRGRRLRFVQPIMGPYVILRGLADRLITEPQLSHPPITSTVPEQLSLLPPSSVPAIEF